MPMLELILFTQVFLGKDANLVNSVDHLFNNFPTKDYTIFAIMIKLNVSFYLRKSCQ